MIYLTGRNPRVGLHVIDIRYIRPCEYEFLSSVEIFPLIYGEKVDRKFGNVQHILETFVCEFNPSFDGNLD